jgi:prepilin-type N-terminal cleavage/methylation domain-containing protein
LADTNNVQVRPAPQRARLVADDGFTLVELMVTLMVLAIGVVSVQRVFFGTLAATNYADNRARATSIATRELEAIQAKPYTEVGLPTGSPSTFEGANTVIVAGSGIVHSGSAEVIDNVTYSMTRWIVEEAGSSAYADAIKRVVIVVDWTDDAGGHELRADAAMYPGGLGPYGGATTSTSTTTPPTPGTPTALVAVVSASNPYDQIDLTWVAGSPTPEYWGIQRSIDNGLNWTVVTQTHPGATTTYSVTGLAHSTTYTFRVRGITGSVTGGYSNEASASTAASAGSCTITSSGASPSTVKKLPSGKLNEDFTITVNTTGSCDGSMTASFDTSTGNTKTVSLSGGTPTFSKFVWKNDYSDWSTGNKTIVVELDGTTVANIALLVTN